MKTIAVACQLFATVSIEAQCTTALAPFGALPGVGGAVTALAEWDPDGPGPLAARIAVGGGFSAAGAQSAHLVASFDPATGQWAAVGTGPTGLSTVHRLLAMQNGDLIAGGAYGSGLPAAQILVRWNGTVWLPFGGLTPVAEGVTALARLQNGDIAVGGHFTAAGAMALPYLGVWNGTTWSSLGGGMDGPVLDLQVLPNGDLLAVGAFTVAGGVPANGIARWNGTAWSALGTGITSGQSQPATGDAAVALPNGDIVVAGAFALAGGAPAANVARWDGVSWSALGGGNTGANVYTRVHSLAVSPTGDLVAGGFFATAGGLAIPNIARWDGSAWSALGAGVPTVSVHALLSRPNGDLVAGGFFAIAGGVGVANIARWDGVAWSALGDGSAPSYEVRALQAMPDGSIVAGGGFEAVGTLEAFRIARWDGVAWSAIGGSREFAARGAIQAIAGQPNGDLVVGGRFFVSRWNGTAWTHLPTNFYGFDGVEAVAVLANGDIVAGGDIVSSSGPAFWGLAHWDGSTWSALGNLTDVHVHAMATLSNGDLVVGGDLTTYPALANGVARWNGVAWSALGPVNTGNAMEVFAIAPLANGALLAGGAFTHAGGVAANNIALWNGASWSPLGGGVNGTVRALHVLPNGDVVATGSFTQAGGVPALGIARWNGAGWSPIGSVTEGMVRATAGLPNGELLLGGDFRTVNGSPAPRLAKLVTTCPATVQNTGAGCGGAAIRAPLPWAGSTWRADATGLPTNGVAFAVSGFASGSLVLSTVSPTALPGCTLHVRPDIVDLRLIANGTASFQFVLPNSAALAGVTFHHQMVPIAAGTSVVTATNALQSTIGVF